MISDIYAAVPSNWELSGARASSVVRLFIDQGVVAERLRAVGLASYHPISSNETAEDGFAIAALP